MKTIHVLGWMDGFEDALGVDLLGKRELDQDAVDVVVVIQVLHNGEKFSRRNSRGRREEATREAKLLAGCNLALYVELGSGVFADKHGGEARTDACGGKHANFIFQFSEDLIPDFEGVENACGHQALAFVNRKKIIAQGETTSGRI